MNQSTIEKWMSRQYPNFEDPEELASAASSRFDIEEKDDALLLQLAKNAFDGYYDDL